MAKTADEERGKEEKASNDPSTKATNAVRADEITVAEQA
jgi:hypothetical protein